MKNHIYGINPVLEALSSDIVINEIIVQTGKSNKRINLILSIARKKKILITHKDKGALNQSFGIDHQGIAAITSGFGYQSMKDLLLRLKEKPDAKLLFLDCIEDPHNLGALIRSACAFDFDAVVIQEKRSAPLSASAIKASAGTAFGIPISLVKNLVNALNDARKSGFWAVGTVLDTDKYLNEIDMDMKIALLIGNEQKGVRNLIARNCDFLVKIPMSSKVDSLNASAAGACAMYEIFRQQNIIMNKK